MGHLKAQAEMLSSPERPRAACQHLLDAVGAAGVQLRRTVDRSLVAPERASRRLAPGSRFSKRRLSLLASTWQLLNSAHLQLPYPHDPDSDIAGSYRCHSAGRTQRRAPAIRDRDALP